VSAAELPRLLRLPEGPRRTAAIAAWFQGLYGGKSVPVLVGGAAVELYTRGAYTTGDLDFVGQVPAAVARALEKAGFQREGRHWLHESGELFIELPGTALDPEDRTAVLESDGHRIVIQSVEGLIVDRLASWQFWKFKPDAANAYRLWKDRRSELDPARLNALARKHQVEKALKSLRAFARRLGDREASSEELERWAENRT
jgi:hypothetical protein